MYRQDKKRYTAEPLSLVYYEDNYYLICFYENHIDKKVTYRIDRMDSVEVHEETISETALQYITQSDMGEYTEQTFRMFAGETKTVSIILEASLIGAIFDKFGEDTEIKRIDDNLCFATVKVQVSPAFWSWLFQF